MHYFDYLGFNISMCNRIHSLPRGVKRGGGRLSVAHTR